MSTATAQTFTPSLMAALFDTAGNAMRQAAQHLEARMGKDITPPEFRALVVVAYHSLHVPDSHIMWWAGLPNNRCLIDCRDKGTEIPLEIRNLIISAIYHYWKHQHSTPWRVQPPH